MNAFDPSCDKCTRGTLILVGRRGRFMRRHGVEIEVPCDFMIPTCDECGAERLDASVLKELDSALEKSRLIALREADTVEMDAIADAPATPEVAA